MAIEIDIFRFKSGFNLGFCFASNGFICNEDQISNFLQLLQIEEILVIESSLEFILKILSVLSLFVFF